MAGASQSASVGKGSLAESSATGEQCEASHADNMALAISREESSPATGTSSPIREMRVHGTEMEILEPPSIVGGPMAPPNPFSANNPL